ncbi:MAG TPA: SMC-Scp complex subunit ScpB [Egibacteraceae bacterium]|nr:SMC-Scp complex subunit ScpB [Egibacteraceae bacterium]
MTDPANSPVPAQSVLLDDELRKALEAILLVVEEPVDANTLAQVLEAPTEQVVATLHALRSEYVDAGRGFVLREVAGGWRYYTDPGAAPYVERFVLNGRSGRLSQASLETLAIIAYKQPVTRAQVSQIRGVDADGAVRSLLARGLVEEIGRAELPGQPLLYATTASFLERLGLSSLDELPKLPELAPAGPPPEEPPPGGYKAARRELDALARGDVADGEQLAMRDEEPAGDAPAAAEERW